MNRPTLSALLLMMALLAVPAAAQTITTTRMAEGASAREQKAEAQRPVQADRLERALDRIERLMGQLGSTRDGFSVRIGGIEDGAGLAAGPAWRHSNLLQRRIRVAASAAASIARDYDYGGVFTVPALGDHRVSLRVSGSAGRLAQERYFGTGFSSSRSDESSFALDRTDVRADAVATAGWLRLSAGAGIASRRSTDGAAAGIPGISARWQSDVLPKLNQNLHFTRLGASATVDWRDVPQNPRGGGLYRVAVDRFVDRTRDRYSFARVDVHLEQHLSWWRRQRLLTLRGIAALTQPDAGHEVPFYMLPTLGGSQLLRGFVTDRFRDRNLLALQAEYAYDLWPFLSAVAFYEAGVVAPDWRTLALNNMKRDYGLGFRLGTARTVALRTDVALGSGEGTRITMRFSHAF